MDNKRIILGEVKVLRAIVDVSYDGRLISGRKKEKVILGSKDNYDFVINPGAEFGCCQDTARGLFLSGKVEIISGGACTVYPKEDGAHAYTNWLYAGDPAAEFELAEVTAQWTCVFPGLAPRGGH